VYKFLSFEPERWVGRRRRIGASSSFEIIF
jgi:hypothetical protein